MSLIITVLYGLFAVSIAVTTLQVIFVWRFRGRAALAVDRSLHYVSILKPICGLDDGLEENLESFAALRGLEHEIILSVADEEDRALPLIHRVRQRHPEAPFRLVIGGEGDLERGNRKVARLIAAEQHAVGDILYVSDSNVRVEPDDFARTIAHFAGRRVGCVSNLFTGQSAETLGARIESLHLLSFVVPGCVLASYLDVPCVVGKSLAISREALNAIGGFRQFAGVLAEDQAIGLAVKRAGYEVALSPVVVRNVIVKRTVKRAFDRQVRWNKIRYAFSRRCYFGEFLINPLPLAVALMFAGNGSMLPLTIILRVAQLAILAGATGAEFSVSEALTVPLLDLLQFCGQFVPFTSHSVEWRGTRLSIGPNTVLMTEDGRLAA